MPETGFSSTDRETLTTIKVQLGYVIENQHIATVRIAKLEETRLTARDLEELMADTDTLRVEKKALEERVAVIEKFIWKATGAAMAVGALAGYASHFIGK